MIYSALIAGINKGKRALLAQRRTSVVKHVLFFLHLSLQLVYLCR